MSATDEGIASALATGENATPAVPATPRRASTRSAFLWSYVLTVGRFATTGIVTFVLAGYLKPEQYGVVALAMVWVGLAQSLALHGPAQSVTQRSEVTARHFDAAFWSTVGGSVVLTAVFAVAAPFWASVNGSSELVYVCWALAPAILLNALVAVPDAILRRNMQFRSLSRRILAASVLSGAMAIAAAVLGAGAWALVIQQLTQALFSAVAVWFAVDWRPRHLRVGAEFRDLSAFAAHSLAGIIAFFVANRTDAIVLGAIFGPAVIGLYRFAIRITDMVGDVAVGGLSQVSLPHLSQSSAERGEFAERLSRVIHIGVLTSFPLFGILIPTGPWLLRLIGPDWVDAAPALQMLCFVGAVAAMGSIFASALQAGGRPGTVAWTSWLMAGMAAAGAWAVGTLASSATPRMQAFAVALASAIVNVIIAGIGGVVLFRRILRQPAGPAFQPAVPAMVAAVVGMAAGLGIDMLLRDVSPFTGLIVTGCVSVVAALLVMIFADNIVRAQVRGTLRGLLLARSPAGSGMSPAIIERSDGRSERAPTAR
jgi:PST family polysaccharide transporter